MSLRVGHGGKPVLRWVLVAAVLCFAVILVTHDPTEVRGLGNSLAVLQENRIAEHGSLDEITANPQSALGMAVVRALDWGA